MPVLPALISVQVVIGAYLEITLAVPAAAKFFPKYKA
jgi:hypothetical protein